MNPIAVFGSMQQELTRTYNLPWTVTICVKALSIYCIQVALLVEYFNGLGATGLVVESHGRRQVKAYVFEEDARRMSGVNHRFRSSRSSSLRQEVDRGVDGIFLTNYII